MDLFHPKTSPLVVTALKTPIIVLLKTPRLSALLIAGVLIIDVIIDAIIPVAIIIGLMINGIIPIISGTIVSIVITMGIVAMTFGTFGLASDVHNAILWGGTLYTYRDRNNVLRVTTFGKAILLQGVKNISAIDVPGLMLWRRSKMRMFSPELVSRGNGEPLNAEQLLKKLFE
jgi:hypothetical protein